MVRQSIRFVFQIKEKGTIIIVISVNAISFQRGWYDYDGKKHPKLVTLCDTFMIK